MIREVFEVGDDDEVGDRNEHEERAIGRAELAAAEEIYVSNGPEEKIDEAAE